MKRPFPLLLLTAFLFSACSNPTQGMYFSIEKEQKTQDASSVLPNTLEVTGLAVFDNLLWVSAKRLYVKSGDTWTKMETPSVNGVDYPEILDLAGTTNNLYLLAADSSGQIKILSKASASAPYVINTSPAVGTPSSLEPIQGDATQVVLNVFLSAGSYQAYGLSTGSLSAPLLPTDQSHSSPVIQAAANAGTYYLVNRSRLFQGGNLTGALTAENFTHNGLSLGNIGGLVVTDQLSDPVGSQVVASSSKGKLFVRNGQNDWTAVNSDTLMSYGDADQPLALGRLFAYDRGTGQTPQNILLAGTDKNGYAEAYRTDGKNSVAHPALTSTATFSTSTAADISFTNFIVFDGSLYAGTLNGLWKRSSTGVWDYE